MNRVVLMGRLTKDPEVRYTQGQNSMAVARFNLAVDRRKSGDKQEADFISIVSFGKLAEFAEKYLKKGIKIALEGRIQTGSYTGKDGQKVYTTDVIADSMEFAESKNSSSGNTQSAPQNDSSAGFMAIPDDLADEGLPFN